MLCIDFLGAIKNSLKKQKGNRAASLSLPGVALERERKSHWRHAAGYTFGSSSARSPGVLMKSEIDLAGRIQAVIS